MTKNPCYHYILAHTALKNIRSSIYQIGSMTITETALTFLSLISTVCAIIFGYSAFRRNGRADISAHAAKDATFLTEIGYIKANTDEIKSEQKEQRKMNTEVISRLTAVEESVRQAHKRINRLDSEVNTGKPQ